MKTINNEPKKRLDLYAEDGTRLGELEYMSSGTGEIYATHTEVFPGNEGKGYATLLLDELVSLAKKRNAKIVPICPFVKAAFKKNPEKYKDVIKD